jgi:hypothetical protein
MLCVSLGGCRVCRRGAAYDDHPSKSEGRRKTIRSKKRQKSARLEDSEGLSTYYAYTRKIYIRLFLFFLRT